MNNRIQSIEARELFRASQYCYKVERLYESLIIIMALMFSLLSIFMKFVPSIAVMLKLIAKHDLADPSLLSEDFIKLSDLSLNIGKIISFISGLWLILQIYLSHRANVRHKEAVNIEERYDVFVLGIDPNRNIMRPITGSMIRHYASRIELKNQEKKIENKLNQSITVFQYQKSQFEYIHGLMIYARSKFFNFIWFIYFATIICFSLFVDVSVTDALSQIFFPSLSAISLIVYSMIKYNEQFRYNGNSLDCIKAIEEEMIKERRATIPASSLRNIQDSLFISRLNSFSVPYFVERMYQRYLKKKNHHLAELEANTRKKNKKDSNEKSKKVNNEKKSKEKVVANKKPVAVKGKNKK